MAHRRKWIGLAAAVGFLLLPTRSCGWGEEGHVIVAKIAELNLTKEAKAGIRHLLGLTPISDRKIATFADFVRHNQNYPEFSKAAPWHFIDIPLEAEQYDPDADYCKDGQCVVGQVERLKKILADENQPDKERRQALIFVVHFVGDLHQPLHCATRGDRGGNALAVRFLGQGGNHLNLHSVWDVNLVRSCMGDLEAVDFANRLNQNIKKEDRQSWGKGEAKDWAWESHLLAVRRAYKKGNTDLPMSGHPDLDEGYVERGKETVVVQLQRGGVRLAKILNDGLR